MNRVRTLGLMLMAVVAMSAIGANAASVLVEPDSTEVVAESHNTKFAMPNGLTIECKAVVLKGKSGVKSNTIKAVAVTALKECATFGVAVTFVEVCGTEMGRIEANSTTAVSVTLAAGCQIRILMAGCSMTIAGKQELAGTWTNPTGGKGAQMGITKAPFVETSTGGVCGASGTGFLSGTFSVSPAQIRLK